MDIGVVQKLLGWNPAEGPPPPTDQSGASIYERLTRALVLWQQSRGLGISIGFTLPQLLQHLLSVYPYQGPGDLSPQDYEDQVHFVTTLVFVLTNHGTLRCETVRRSTLSRIFSYLSTNVFVYMPTGPSSS